MKYIVVGMGKTGLSIARYWHNLGYAVTAIDNRIAPPCQQEFIQLLGDKNCNNDCNFKQWECKQFAEYNQVAISPGIDPNEIAIPFNKRCNDASLFSQHWQYHYKNKAHLIAITGTNGKSTAVSLAQHIAQTSGKTAIAVGNIGIPMLDALLQWQDNPPDIVVIELSSFQLEIAKQFYSDAAVVLNISEDHLDRHKTIERYTNIKGNIYNNTQKAVINIDSPYAQLYCRKIKVEQQQQSLSLISRSAHWTIFDNAIVNEDKLVIGIDDLSLACQQQLLGTMAVCALLKEVISLNLSALSTFSGLAHRQQWVTDDNNIRYINDSKATNVSAALFSVQNIQTHIVLIAGGQGKKQDFSPLQTITSKLRAVILIGEDAKNIEKILCLSDTPCHFANLMNDAVALAKDIARQGDTVLLAPACASFDMFDNFEARGNQFIQSVRKLTTHINIQ